MKSISIFATATFAFFLLAFTPITTTWVADSTHSHFGFSIRHMGIADFHGSFNEYEATIKGEKPDFSDAVVDLTCKMSSIYTGNEGRDTHLQSADFFDAEKYPTFTFKSTSFKKTAENEYKVTGNLNLHGVTKEITLKAVNTGTGIHPMNKQEMFGFKVTGTFNRFDFNISPDSPAAMLSNEVALYADLEFIKA